MLCGPRWPRPGEAGLASGEFNTIRATSTTPPTPDAGPHRRCGRACALATVVAGRCWAVEVSRGKRLALDPRRTGHVLHHAGLKFICSLRGRLWWMKLGVGRPLTSVSAATRSVAW